MRTKNFYSEIKYFSPQNMPELKDIASFHNYRKGQTFFYKGHVPYGLFVLISGEVEIKYGKDRVERVESPAFLGISAFMKKSFYAGTAKALSNCEIYFLSFSVYKNLIAEKHQIALWVNQ